MSGWRFSFKIRMKIEGDSIRPERFGNLFIFYFVAEKARLRKRIAKYANSLTWLLVKEGLRKADVRTQV